MFLLTHVADINDTTNSTTGRAEVQHIGSIVRNSVHILTAAHRWEEIARRNSWGGSNVEAMTWSRSHVETIGLSTAETHLSTVVVIDEHTKSSGNIRTRGRSECNIENPEITIRSNCRLIPETESILLISELTRKLISDLTELAKLTGKLVTELTKLAELSELTNLSTELTRKLTELTDHLSEVWKLASTVSVLGILASAITILLFLASAVSVLGITVQTQASVASTTLIVVVVTAIITASMIVTPVVVMVVMTPVVSTMPVVTSLVVASTRAR